MDAKLISEFYKKDFSFSYSSINKLLFSPKLFYKDYIEGDRELSTEKHLIEGKLVHCLLFEPEQLKNKFKIIPEKTPSDNIRKVLHKIHDGVNSNQNLLEDTAAWNDVILQALINQNLYQSLKKDEARLAKIKTKDNELYWKFISNPNVDVIDNDTLDRCNKKVEIIKSNKKVMELLDITGSDFELDPIRTYSEKFLQCKLNNFKFGLKGYVDHYVIDDNKKSITIIDLKTTSKSLSDFAETVDYYKYWLQAIIYCKLVFENHRKECDGYEILFKFIVIDKYNQVYPFSVTGETLSKWGEALADILQQVDYHYTNKNYSLPYDFLVNDVSL
jgi:hypothetical protein